MPVLESAIKIGVYYEHLTQAKVADKIGELTKDCGWSVEKIAISSSNALPAAGRAAAASDFDAVIVTLGGRESVSFFSEFRAAVYERRAAPRPLTIGMTVGLVLDRAFYGTYSFRDGADVLLVNRNGDIEKLRDLFAGYKSGGPKIIACRCPIFSGLSSASGASTGAVTQIVFAVQTDVPSAEAEREYIIDELIALAGSDPKLKIKIKPKHRLDEVSAHPQKFPYEEILSRKDQQKNATNITVDYGDMAALIQESDVVISVSSTAVIEALSYGKRAAAIADLGIRENLGNTYFLKSGLLTTFDRLRVGEWPACQLDWLSAELGAPQLPEVLSSLVGDMRQAREGRLDLQASIFNPRSCKSLAPRRPKPASFPAVRKLALKAQSIAALLDESDFSPLEAGRAAFARGDYRGAIAMADYALRRTPSSSLNMQLAANAYEQLGMFDEAMGFIKKAAKARPGERRYKRDYYRIIIKTNIHAMGQMPVFMSMVNALRSAKERYRSSADRSKTQHYQTANERRAVVTRDDIAADSVTRYDNTRRGL